MSQISYLLLKTMQSLSVDIINSDIAMFGENSVPESVSSTISIYSDSINPESPIISINPESPITVSSDLPFHQICFQLDRSNFDKGNMQSFPQGEKLTLLKTVFVSSRTDLMNPRTIKWCEVSLVHFTDEEIEKHARKETSQTEEKKPTKPKKRKLPTQLLNVMS